MDRTTSYGLVNEGSIPSGLIQKVINTSYCYFLDWAHSSTDRITGFGPVDEGSIPSGLILK